MPMYEYSCKACGHLFEELARPGRKEELPPCPECKGKKTMRLMSTPCLHGVGKGPGSPDSPSGKNCAGCAGGNCASC